MVPPSKKGRQSLQRRGRIGSFGVSIEYRSASTLCYSYNYIYETQSLQVALAFVNDAVASTHGNVRIDSVFISPSGEWKLGGFELLSSPKEDTAVLYVRFGSLEISCEMISNIAVLEHGKPSSGQYNVLFA